jgi:hypothetical protein
MFGPELIEKLARLDRLTAEIATDVGQFERSGEWALEGASSVVAWLRAQGMAPADAARLAALGRRLVKLPVLASAWREGDVTGGQVRAIAARVPERLLPLFAEHEAAVVPALARLDVVDTARAMTDWSARAEALDADAAGPMDEPKREVRLSRTLGGRWVLDGDIDPEGGALVERALALADSGDFAVPASRRRADALVDVARFFLDNQTTRRGGRLDNLVLLCTRHHHLLHAKSGFEAKLLPDAAFEVTLPSGVVRTTRPPPATLPEAA